VPAESVSLSFRKNQPWDNNMQLFGLKIGWDIARAFLAEAALTVLPPDLVYSGSGSNHNVSSRFHLFGIFSSFTGLMM
jgi:hypothetical protein